MSRAERSQAAVGARELRLCLWSALNLAACAPHHLASTERAQVQLMVSANTQCLAHALLRPWHADRDATVPVQSAVADKNVSETVYMAESLYLRYDIPFIMQPILQALTRRGLNVSAINSTHVLFTVRLRESLQVLPVPPTSLSASVNAASCLAPSADTVKVIKHAIIHLAMTLILLKNRQEYHAA